MVIAALSIVLIGYGQSTPLAVLDEESYLYIAENIFPKRPYDWSLPWPPYSTDDAFIFAHPPLFMWWVWLLKSWFGFSIVATKVLAGLPAQIILGISVVSLCRPKGKRWLWALAALLLTPIFNLSISRGLMPDLWVSALGAAGLALWFQGESRKDWRWSVFAGLFLGLAAWTKYPALLLPLVVLIHSTDSRRLFYCLGGWLLVWGGGELWLWTIYDRIHFIEVLQRASEIGRGPPLQRISGVLVRLSVGAPIVLLLCIPFWRVAGFGLLAGGILWGVSDLPIPLLPLVCFGGAGVFSLGAIAVSREKEAWCATWGFLVILGVFGGHNFAAPRYCLPAMVPIAILVGYRIKSIISLPATRLVLILSGGLSIVIGLGEKEYAKSAAGLAETVIGTHSKGYFSGEWTFRHQMRDGGWTFWRGEALCGTEVAVAVQCAPAAVFDDWTLIKTYDGLPGSIRLVQANSSAGYYAETVGKMPMMWSTGPLESVQIWKAPPCLIE